MKPEFFNSGCNKRGRKIMEQSRKLIKKISEGIFKIEKCFLGIMLVVIVVLLLTNVILRYAANAPLAWADEIARFLFTWVSFIGASACLKKKGHVAIDNFVVLLPQKKRALVNIITTFCIIGVMIMTIYYCYLMMSMLSGATLSSVSIPQNALYICLPLASVFMIVHLLEFLVDDTRTILTSGGGARC
jgi:TRAP-type C4-dicarboxylate transport system permease small subunit